VVLNVGVWLLLVVSPLMLLGQGTGGSILGEVRDETGAIIPGAAVTAINLETGITRAATTNESGRYRIQNLPIGSYRVDASFSGFKSVSRSGINLAIGQDAVVNIALQVGDVAERVEVTGEAPLLETTSAVLGGIVEQKAILDLPLDGRSFLELATLRAGATNSYYGGRSVSQGYGKKISLGGARFTSNVFLLDGTVMNDSYNSAGSAAGGTLGGVETVREFKVITNAYSAEYGQHTGGVVNAVTRGGTNELHGSVYEFLRNDNLDAARWEDNRSGAEKAEFRRNQFGVSIGGPVRRDKTFFFANYEGLREQVGSNELLTVPDEDVRRGILRGQNIGLNSKVVPYLTRSWPLPPAGAGRNLLDGRVEYTRPNNEPTDQNFLSVRADHAFSGSDTFFVRYTIDHALRESVNSIDAIVNERSRNQFLTLQYDKILSPTLLNSLNLGYTRTNTGSASEMFPGFTAFSFTDSNIGTGSVSVGGITSTGVPTSDPRTFILNNYQFRDDMTYTRGSHTMKFGGFVSRLQHNDLSMRRPSGDFSFETLEDFMRNIPLQSLLTFESDSTRYMRQTLAGLYYQDDFQLRPNLMLNWGVRWEMFSRPHEKLGRNPISLEEKFFDPTTTERDIRLGDSIFLTNPSLNSFAPRVGFAWTPFGDAKTSIRGGSGFFFEPLVYWVYRMGVGSTLPMLREGRLTRDQNIDFPNAFFTQKALFSGTSRYEAVQPNPNHPYVVKYSLEIQRQLDPTLLVRVGYSGSRGVHQPVTAPSNGRRAQVQSDGTLFFPSTPSTDTNNPNFGRTRFRWFYGGSHYHSLRMEVEKRISGGLQLQGAYTLAKNIDDGTSVTGGTDFDNDSNPRHYTVVDRGLSALDVRHTFSFNFVYELPGQNLGGTTGYLLGGWRLNGLTRLSSGEPFSAATGFDRQRTIEGTNYPNLVAGGSNNAISGTTAGCTFVGGVAGPYNAAAPATSSVRPGQNLGTPEMYFDPCAFELQPAGTLGNLGRNTLKAPGVATLDLSVAKTFGLPMLREGSQLEFRGEFFNVLNHANFGLPQRSLFTNATTVRVDPGRITSTITTARQIQFGLKLTF
jgi:hypothetical protein